MAQRIFQFFTPIRWIAPWPGGVGTEIAAQLLKARPGEVLGQSIFIATGLNMHQNSLHLPEACA